MYVCMYVRQCGDELQKLYELTSDISRNSLQQNLNINLLKPTGYYTYHQVEHSKILHADYTAFMFFVWLSEETVTFVLHIITRLVFITEVECVYCAVRTESVYKTDTFRP